MLTELSDELLIKILSELDVESLLNTSESCQKLKRLAGEPLLWRDINYRDYGKGEELSQAKAAYIQNYQHDPKRIFRKLEKALQEENTTEDRARAIQFFNTIKFSEAANLLQQLRHYSDDFVYDLLKIQDDLVPHLLKIQDEMRNWESWVEDTYVDALVSQKKMQCTALMVILKNNIEFLEEQSKDSRKLSFRSWVA